MQRQIAEVVIAIGGAPLQAISRSKIKSVRAFRLQRRDRLRSFDELQFEFGSIEFEITLFEAQRRW
jgi:hypothetical protein